VVDWADLEDDILGFDPDSQAVTDMTPGSRVLKNLNDGFVLPPTPAYRVHAGLNGSKLGRVMHPGQDGDCIVSLDSANGPGDVFEPSGFQYESLSHDRAPFIINWCDDDTLVNSPTVVLDLIATIRGTAGGGVASAGAAPLSGGTGIEPPLAGSVLGLVQPGQVNTHQLTVPVGLANTAFALFWLEGKVLPNLGFSLRRPDGSVVSPADPDVIDQITTTGDGLFGVLMKSFVMSGPAAGAWEITVNGASVPAEGQPYLIALLPDSQVVLGVDVAPPLVSQGQPTVVRATLFDGEAPVVAPFISGQVITPTGDQKALVLRDNGTGGDAVAGDLIYSRSFASTADCGGYSVVVTATGSSSEGVATRQQTGFFQVQVPGDAVRNPCDADDDGDGISDDEELNVRGTDPLDFPPVGGIAELPDIAQASKEARSSPSELGWLKIAFVTAIGIAMAAVGAYYLRRRWLG